MTSMLNVLLPQQHNSYYVDVMLQHNMIKHDTPNLSSFENVITWKLYVSWWSTYSIAQLVSRLVVIEYSWLKNNTERSA